MESRQLRSKSEPVVEKLLLFVFRFFQLRESIFQHTHTQAKWRKLNMIWKLLAMNPHHITDSGPVRFSRLFFTSIFFIFILVNVERFARKETHSHTHTTHNTTQHKTHSQTYSHTQSIPVPDHIYPSSDAVTL